MPRANYNTATAFVTGPDLEGRGARYPANALGVELEIEFDGPLNVELLHIYQMNRNISNHWVTTKDGSLRGHGYEFISKPFTLDFLMGSVTDLFDCFKSAGVVIKQSHRTSTHIHLNFSKNKLNELYQFLLLYYFLEPTLFCLTEEDRWHNTFCVSSEMVSSNIARQAENFRPFWKFYEEDQAAKYASLNLVPLTKLGTLECRIFHGATNAEEVCVWLTAMMELKLFATSFNNIKDLYKYLEVTPFEEVLKKVFQKTHKHIFEHVMIHEKSLYELANRGNSMAFPLLSLEKKMEAAKNFLAEEKRKMELEIAKLREKENKIEDYIIWVDDVAGDVNAV